MKPFSVATKFAFSAALVLPLAGCKTTVDDPTLQKNVAAALAADPSINKQPITTTVVNGQVTLTGSVTDDTAASVAANDAARVKGVKQVITQMTVAGVQLAPTVTAPVADTSASAVPVTRVATKQERVAIAAKQPLPPPAPSAPVAPPQPVYRDITLPAGASLPIRITQTLDSETTQDGQPFNGVVTSDVSANGYVVIPRGSAVSGRVIDAKDATHFKGSSHLSIELTAVRRHGSLIAIHTEPFTVEGKGRGKNTALKVGGGAAIGAVLGGIFGGGKGAAIGAAAGGGGGAAVQGFTRGEQVQISSETLIRFRLADSITVRTTEQSVEDDRDSSGLQTR
jgi:hypothetical protein